MSHTYHPMGARVAVRLPRIYSDAEPGRQYPVDIDTHIDINTVQFLGDMSGTVVGVGPAVQDERIQVGAVVLIPNRMSYADMIVVSESEIIAVIIENEVDDGPDPWVELREVRESIGWAVMNHETPIGLRTYLREILGRMNAVLRDHEVKS